jgi:hypothetical protein
MFRPVVDAVIVIALHDYLAGFGGLGHRDPGCDLHRLRADLPGPASSASSGVS